MPPIVGAPALAKGTMNACNTFPFLFALLVCVPCSVQGEGAVPLRRLHRRGDGDDSEGEGMLVAVLDSVGQVTAAASHWAQDVMGAPAPAERPQPPAPPSHASADRRTLSQLPEEDDASEDEVAEEDQPSAEAARRTLLHHVAADQVKHSLIRKEVIPHGPLEDESQEHEEEEDGRSEGAMSFVGIDGISEREAEESSEEQTLSARRRHPTTTTIDPSSRFSVCDNNDRFRRRRRCHPRRRQKTCNRRRDPDNIVNRRRRDACTFEDDN
eukprot:TRINITY_DN75761_c0_g1_i1.p1 TRINITY_DN75761_c0_g1~~TRINITY_DN75761_c0_g1_i1.p1  ORF type:complete len:291 (+),score=64.28 TRINITY_DN75761_c0_g1_i1:68-874(+)